MIASYCPSCYRDLADGARCSSCAQHQIRARPTVRLPLLIGFLGLPLLIFGILGPSLHACIAGAILSGCGVVAHIVLTLRE